MALVSLRRALFLLALLAPSTAKRAKITRGQTLASAQVDTGNPCQCHNCKPTVDWNGWQAAYAAWISTGHTHPQGRSIAWESCKIRCTQECFAANGNADQAFPWTQALGPLVMLATEDHCLVAPEGGGWGLSSVDTDACTKLRAIKLDAEGHGQFQDPRTGLCFGWVHWFSEQQETTYFHIPGQQGPAFAQCGPAGRHTYELDKDHSFNTVFHEVHPSYPCIRLFDGTGSAVTTPFCFHAAIM